MAPKKPSESTSRSNKIRFVLVEADISDGNLSELTQAITHALKPAIAPSRPPLRTTPPQVLPPSNNGGAQEEQEIDTELEQEASEAQGNGEEAIEASAPEEIQATRILARLACR